MHRSQRLQETHSWLSSRLSRGLYQNEEGCVPRDQGGLGSACGLGSTEMGRKKRTSARERKGERGWKEEGKADGVGEGIVHERADLFF